MPPSKEISILNSFGFSFWNWPGAGEEAANFFGLSHAVIRPANVKTVCVGGQVGIRDDESVPTDIHEEVDEVFAHVERALKSAGLRDNAWEHVYKITAYLAHTDEVPQIGEALRKAMEKYCKNTRPALTAVDVHKLFLPTLHLEVEVEAFLPCN